MLPSLSEPWGLVVNEAAASGLPLLVSSPAGCAATLVPEPEGTTGGRFDPTRCRGDDDQSWPGWRLYRKKTDERWAGARPRSFPAWGPDRFARGVVEALELAKLKRQRQAHTTLPATSRS